MARRGGRPWRVVGAACLGATLLAAGAAGTQAQAPAPADGRQRVALPAMARDKILLGMQTHRKFDELADRVKAGGAREDLLRGLAEVTANCVACHATFRLDEAR